MLEPTTIPETYELATVSMTPFDVTTPLSLTSAAPVTDVLVIISMSLVLVPRILFVLVNAPKISLTAI